MIKPRMGITHTEGCDNTVMSKHLLPAQQNKTIRIYSIIPREGKMSGSNYKIIKTRPGAYRLQAAAPDAATDSAGAVAVAGCSAVPC